ncbi:cyclic pyranopterin monophosphate synthase MoaC [Bacillus glycinifermentans]|uniref:Cyclic pyranopterin monophosphate synthase n=1 Tax=Bacillus glycinifermentans TaxID=1664069 RepID=A0A0T6BQ03_9BACI|nr:cyclic pyranopterin monophosphate synthase MoaC [Bacillus glycinifermentans]ATH94499.1 cyclic pyranopterin monophosphate synthase MoaC [Bacillus glycinifermentans]KRT93713.1 molybdenum cofactor biosynthesis protein C [Bacillus glycinifermentans]MEC0486177.1 cyclic pyranopterin monophosphate synthase MoaC [Bacillus glycinifermentans]UOY88012.1 cyclic pyranopterin monophosphate synthase MoaC [Bacillus glycinifermentans]
MNQFTHFNEQGRAKMVDISEKEASVRTAVALSSVSMKRDVHEKIKNQEMGKGDVLAVAQVAGIMAAKQTSDIIPMCHPIALKGVDIAFRWEEKDQNSILHIQSTVKTKGSTGVEMEALTSVSACALTVYDMCKAADKGMVIGPTYLAEKTGGKSGDYKREKADVNMEDRL